MMHIKQCTFIQKEHRQLVNVMCTLRLQWGMIDTYYLDLTLKKKGPCNTTAGIHKLNILWQN